MNINLANNYPIDADGAPDSFQSQIEEHQDIMKGADFNIIGPAVLIPDPDPNYPGAYQVWNPIRDEDNRPMWVWINPDGVALESDALPLAGDMEGLS